MSRMFLSRSAPGIICVADVSPYASSEVDPRIYGQS